MGLKHRAARLEKAGGGGACCCPIELIEVRDGESDDAEAEPLAPARRDAAGRFVCDKCGRPCEPGGIRRVEIRLTRRKDDQAGP